MTGPCGSSSLEQGGSESPRPGSPTTFRIARPPVPAERAQERIGPIPSGMPSSRWASGRASADSSRYGGRPPARATGRYSRVDSQSGLTTA